MTLQNGMIDGDSALLWADTGYVDAATGKLFAFDSKLCQGLLWPFAGSLSTIGRHPHTIATEIGQAFPMGLSGLLRETQRVLRRFCRKPGECGRVLLAAYEGGPRLFMVASDGIGLVAPFEPVELEAYTSSGNSLPPYLLAQASGWTPERMLAQIDAQRAEPHDNPAAGIGTGHWIGGNGVEMRVTASGVTSRVVREWGDQVGERIVPLAA